MTRKTIYDVMHTVFSTHDIYELAETTSGANVELDTIAQYADNHKVIVIEDVLSNGNIVSTENGGYILRRNIHLSFVSKVQLDERGNERLDLIDGLLISTTNAVMHLLHELDHEGYGTYADCIYQQFTNRQDANMNMIDVQLFITDPIRYCYDYD